MGRSRHPPPLPPAPQLAEQVLDYATKLKQAEQQLETLQAERDAEAKRRAEAAEVELKERKTNAENLAKAVLEQVGKMQQTESVGTGRCADEAIKSLLKTHPAECEKVLQVAHLCSSRAAQLETQLQQEKLRTEQNKLRTQYHAAVHNAVGTGTTTTATADDDSPVAAEQVRASKRQRIEDDAANLLPKTTPVASRYAALGLDCGNVCQAYQQFSASNSRGSSTANMAEIAGIMDHQRRAGFR